MLMPKMVIMMVLKQPNASSKPKTLKLLVNVIFHPKIASLTLGKRLPKPPTDNVQKKDILLVMTFLRTLSFVQRMRGWTTVH